MKIRANVMAAAIAAMLCAGPAAAAQTTSHWDNAAGGNWHEAANWNPADVPDTVTEEAFIDKTGAYVVTVDKSQYGGGLTCRRLSFGGTTSDVVVVNANPGSELDWQIGASGIDFRGLYPALYLCGGTRMNLTNVNLVVRGRFDAIWGTSPGIRTAPGSGFSMKKGNLQVVDDGTAGGLDAQGTVALDETAFYIENMRVHSVGTFTAATGTVDRGLSVSVGGAVLMIQENSTVTVSGDFASGPIRSGHGLTYITNATMRVTGEFRVGKRGAGFYDCGGLVFVESGAGVGMASLWIGGMASWAGKTSPKPELWIRGGAVTNIGLTRLGLYGGTASHQGGHGLLAMPGGSFRTAGMNLGCTVNDVVHTGAADPDGWYQQTGGTSVISGTLTFYSNINGLDGCGAMQFVVGSNAVMRLTGAGMAIGGDGPWVLDFTGETNFDTRGTLIFAPDGVETQTLLAFAEESGADAAMTTNHMAMGTLDLRELVAAGKTLDIVPAGNFATNAVYVQSLRMGNTPAPGAYFMASSNSPESQIYVYYDYQHSDVRRGGVFSDEHGSLIPINLPRGTIILVP